jgi:hypothetical protein
MRAELRARLDRLSDDLRASRVDRAALFWLKVFTDMAMAAGGSVRSDRWVDAGLAAARAIPGLAATATEPRRELVGRYGLFRFVRLRDGAEFSGVALDQLDWQYKYEVGLLPEFGDDLAALQQTAEDLWAELGGVAPEFVALEEVLARYGPQGRAGLIEVLHEAQAIFGGWLPRAAVERVAVGLGMPVADV